MPDCFEFLRVCPEAGIGMGVPRPPVRLLESGDDIALRGIEDENADHSDNMKAFVRQFAVDNPSLSGYIFKSRSPSCAVDDADILESSGTTRKGSGMFSAGIREYFPLVPVIDESALQDRQRRLAFIEHVIVFYRWRDATRNGLTPVVLRDFHNAHRFNLLAHDESTCLMLDDLVENLDAGRIDELAEEYIMDFIGGLAGTVQPDYVSVFLDMLSVLPGTMAADRNRLMRHEINALEAGEVSLGQVTRSFLQLPEVQQSGLLRDSYFLRPYECDFALRYN
jgi:uncharacterized protein YbbK (DUF523 family)/uncharacterized protein YbgA (DUF1722 family)